MADLISRIQVWPQTVIVSLERKITHGEGGFALIIVGVVVVLCAVAVVVREGNCIAADGYSYIHRVRVTIPLHIAVARAAF